MKRIWLILFGLAAVMTAAAESQIVWLSTVHNFGAFDEDQGTVSCEFKFVNIGDEPVTVLAARASCGCTQPAYPREAVAPGDTAVITVAYNPEGRPGRFSKTVSVETSGTPRKTKLSIKGVVIGGRESVAGRYPVDKGALQFRNPAVLFGQVMKQHLKTEFAEAYNRSSDSIRLRVVRKPSYIDVNFEPKTVGPGEQVSVICYLRTTDKSLWGLVEDSIMLSTGKEEFALPFTAIIKEDFSKITDADREKAPVARLAENSVDFGRLAATASPQTRTAVLTNEGKNPLEIRRVYTADRGVSVTIDRQSLKKGKSAEITVTVDPSAVPGDILNARISVITNDPANPVQTLRVVGEIK